GGRSQGPAGLRLARGLPGRQADACGAGKDRGEPDPPGPARRHPGRRPVRHRRPGHDLRSAEERRPGQGLPDGDPARRLFQGGRDAHPGVEQMSGIARSFGVRVKLQIAFGVVAVMTVIATSVAITSFSATERGFQHVASRDVPMMADAMRLSVTSGEIAAAAARLVSAQTPAEEKAISALISEKSQALKLAMGKVRNGDASAAFNQIEAVARRLDPNLAALEKAISERSELSAKLKARLDAVTKAHGIIGDKL